MHDHETFGYNTELWDAIPNWKWFCWIMRQ
jgi:hypothetical protein